MKTIAILDIIHTPHAILQKFGLQLFDYLAPIIANGETIEVSFLGIENATSGFFNASFGNLYKEFGEAVIQRQLVFSDLSDPDWEEQLEDAKQLALNPERAALLHDAITELFD
jgi:hypothetical protein